MLRACAVFVSPMTVDVLGHLMHHGSLAASQTAVSVAESSFMTKYIVIQTGQVFVFPTVISILILVVSIPISEVSISASTYLPDETVQCSSCYATQGKTMQESDMRYGVSNAYRLTFLGL